MTERLLNVAEIAMLTGKSIQTINLWYKWKKLNPEHELAKILPDYVQDGERQKRYWKQSDVWNLIEFDHRIKKGGRNGLFGELTYKYQRRKKENEKKVNGTAE